MPESGDGPEVPEDVTWIEKKFYSWLNPYRAWVLKAFLNVLVIAAFLFAALKLAEFVPLLQNYHDALQAKGCLGTPEHLGLGGEGLNFSYNGTAAE